MPLDGAAGSMVFAVLPSCRRPGLADGFVAAAVEVSHRLVELVDDAWVDESTATG